MKKCTDIAAFATVAADGFQSDSAFVRALHGQVDTAALYSFFYEYFAESPELKLVQTDGNEGYLCFYTFDTIPEFEGDIDLSPYQILENWYQSDYAVLDVLCVRPEYRGMGISDQLIDYFLRFCEQENLKPLVEIFSDAHRGLYERHGFAVTHRAENDGIVTYVLER